MELRLLKAGVTASPADSLIEKPLEENDFVMGKSFGGPYWSNFAVTYADAAEKPLQLYIMPEYEKGSNPGIYLKPSQFYVIAESSEYKEEAAKVISFWTNDIDVNRDVIRADRGVPIAGKVRDAMAGEVSENVKMTFDFLGLAADYAGPIDLPEPPAAPEVTAMMREVNEEVLFEKTTPEEAAQKVIERANEILGR
ncbi:MAG TPA: hypothetical protein VFD57_05710 [Clostridia bacterium]|nr:hypothetical protein [Clostridia bacterium]